MRLFEQEEFELLSGFTMSETAKKGLSGRRLAAIIYIFAKRENDTIKFEDILNLKMDEAAGMLADVDPKDGTE